MNHSRYRSVLEIPRSCVPRRWKERRERTGKKAADIRTYNISGGCYSRWNRDGTLSPRGVLRCPWTVMEEVLHIMQAACGFSMHNEACRRWTKNKALRMRCHPDIVCERGLLFLARLCDRSPWPPGPSRANRRTVRSITR